MVIKMLREEVRKRLVDIITEKLNPDFILLFGSYAKGTAHAESDIDLAYIGNKQLSSYERFILASELAEQAGCEVDLIDITQIDTVFTIQIFEQGVPIYIHDENELVRQTMRDYSKYGVVREQRIQVIEAIKKRGSVFGNE